MADSKTGLIRKQAEWSAEARTANAERARAKKVRAATDAARSQEADR